MKQIDLHVEGQQPRRLTISDNVETINVPKLAADGFAQIVHRHYGRFSADGFEIWEASPPADVRPH